MLVALATAMQESQLGAYPGIDRPNGDGDAGVFQQRQKPGWYGTLEQVTQVGYAARVFLRGKVVSAADVAAARRAGSGPAGPAGYTIPGLKQVRGWENMAVTVAAQKVQRSAFPDAYAKHERISRTLLAVFKDKIDPQSAEAQVTGESMLCGPADAMTCPPTGPGGGVGAEPGRAAGAPLHRPRLAAGPDLLRHRQPTERQRPPVRQRGRRDDPGLHQPGRGRRGRRDRPLAAAEPQAARREVRDLEEADLVGGAAGGGLAALLRDQPALRPRARLHLRRLGRVRRGRRPGPAEQRPAGAPVGQRGRSPPGSASAPRCGPAATPGWTSPPAPGPRSARCSAAGWSPPAGAGRTGS